MKITSMWTYRISNTQNSFGTSLQAYSEKKGDWMHMCFFKTSDIEAAILRYREGMKDEKSNPHYLEFSFNNLLEIARIIKGTSWPVIEEMLNDVCKILKIELEIV